MQSNRPASSAPPSRAGSPDLAPSPPGPVALRHYALAAVAALVHSGDSADSETPELQFLLPYLRAVDPDGSGWAATLLDYLGRPNPEDDHVLQLAAELGLSAIEVLSVSLAAVVEDEPMAGRALAHLQAPVSGSRPTLGLLAAAFRATVETGVRPIDALVTGPAVGSGLLRLVGQGVPLPEMPVEVATAVCLALRGQDGTWPGTVVGLGAMPPVPLPPSITREAQRHAAALRADPRGALVVRSGSLAEAKTVACTVAQALGLRPLFIETDQVAGLAPWLILRRLLPVFSLELGPGERRMLPAVPFYPGPYLALTGPDGGVAMEAATALDWTLPIPPASERLALWQEALGDSAIAEELATYHRHGSGRIAQLGRLARRRSALAGRKEPDRGDIAATLRAGEGLSLEALAQSVPEAIRDAALVTTPTLRRDLEMLVARCRHRDQLAQGLGASTAARYHPGVRALFVGPSGTGKTLAAGWLATRLGLPLYRVDLASVTSKYIGETEKNLAQLLARAEQAEVVLLFDEADSMFGKRTDVKEANDRFANAQTNYLLQRIESFDGITLLTSNSRSRFDSAFSRRLDMIIEFPLPSPEERRALWLSHLGPDHRLTHRELNQLAATTDLTGGQIRNAVLAAAVLAQEEGSSIHYAHVVQGVAGEYRKLGHQMPAGLTSSA